MHRTNSTSRPFFILASTAIILLPVFAHAASFTAGDLVVEEIGDGSTGLTSAAAPVNILEFNVTGAAQTPTQTIALPRASTLPTSSPFNIVDSGSATSEGSLNLSVDGSVLTIPGYNATVGTASVTSTSSATNSRTIGVVSVNGSVDTSTSLNMLSGNNFRTAISANGTQFWAGGATGIAYVASEGATGSSSTSVWTGNTRNLEIFNGQLYASSQSTSFGGTGSHYGIWQIGTGEPNSTLTAANVTLVIDDGTSTSTASPYDFSFSADGLTAYVADDSSSGGGLQKWTRTSVATAFTKAYTISVGSSGARGLTVDWSGSNPILYATTGETSGDRLVEVTDTGSGSAVTTLATAGTDYIFRGVDFVPVPEPSTVLTVIGGLGVLVATRRRKL